jgi:LysM repeat protein
MTNENENENEDEEYEDEDATSESEEDEAEDAEALDESEEESEDEDSVASWGYEEKKSRFSKEMLAGFAAIGVLVAIFGIVVYKKMPGAGESGEVVKTGPPVSLGNPETASPDPNDPFGEGAGDNLGPQNEPGVDGGSPSELVADGSTGNGSTMFGPDANGGGAASLFPDDISNSPLGAEDPFASTSETADLFPGQSDPGVGSESAAPFGTSTASPGSGPNEFADSSRPDPFGGPDLSGGTGSTSPDSLPTEFSSNEGSGKDLFPQNNQFPQNEPNIDGSLNSSLSGDSGSALQPETIGGSNEFGSSTGNESFGTSTDSTLRDDPFGSNAGTGSSEPGGLFDRSPESSLDGGAGGLSDPSSRELPNNPDFGSLDSGPATTSSAPFGSDEPFGTSDSGSAESVFGAPETTSLATSNDPFGTPTSTASNDPFPASTNEPVDLFPDTSSQPTSTASNDPFQPPVTSSPDSSLPSNSPSSISGGPFGNEAFRTDSSSRPSTFASQPSNSGKYTVQDGDSYWNISKKVYGTAKYFQVLADHNRRTIADPQKMKAGVSIETPSASVLQGRMKTVRRTTPSARVGRIEASGRADRSGPAGSVGSASSSGESVIVGRRETKPKQPSGILFNEQGYPMFQIGETDTLTSIAADHLGRASRWQQVYNMNRDQLQSPDKLQIGMLLKLPADASRVPLVDRTSSLR